MATMMVQYKVKDFAQWKTVFDSVAGLRTSRGALSDQVYRDASDPNKLIILFTWNSLENAQKWSQSPEVKAARAEAGVDGPPTFTFMNEV